MSLAVLGAAGLGVALFFLCLALFGIGFGLLSAAVALDGGDDVDDDSVVFDPPRTGEANGNGCDCCGAAFAAPEAAAQTARVTALFISSCT